jgi:hypothetical protein
MREALAILARRVQKLSAFLAAAFYGLWLIVTPLVFSSVDPEGHWKLEQWGYNKERNFWGPALTKDQTDNPGDDPIVPYGSIRTGGAATRHVWGRLLTIDIPRPPESYDVIGTVATVVGAGAAGALYNLAKQTILQPGHAVIDAQWQDDGLEIWGGFAGLTSAMGFMSVFGHRASVQISGTMYGNFLPGADMIVMSGFINPVGSTFVEFRCAAVVKAGKKIQPLWGISVGS